MKSHKPSFATVGLAVGGIILVPNVASACSLCMESLVYSTMPWLPFAFLVLMAWFILDWAIRMHTEHHPMPDGKGWPSLHTMIVAPIVSITVILFMGTGAFLTITCLFLVLQLCRELCRPRWPLIGIGRLLSIGALIALLAVVGMGVWWRSQLSTFEVYERFVWSGTSASVSMSKTLAADSSFDVALLRPLLASDVGHRANMALYVLENRRNTADLVLFADLILPRLPEEVPQGNQPWDFQDFYLRRWLERLDLEHIKTRADLQEWLNQMENDEKSPQGQDQGSEP